MVGSSPFVLSSALHLNGSLLASEIRIVGAGRITQGPDPLRIQRSMHPLSCAPDHVCCRSAALAASRPSPAHPAPLTPRRCADARATCHTTPPWTTARPPQPHLLDDAAAVRSLSQTRPPRRAATRPPTEPLSRPRPPPQTPRRHRLPHLSRRPLPRSRSHRRHRHSCRRPSHQC